MTSNAAMTSNSIDVRSDLVGDMALLRGGVVDGWCWSPSRPEQRLRVEVLVEGTVAARVEAALFRRDLLLLRIGDGRHGFRLTLPPGARAPLRSGCLIEVREQVSGQMFARTLHEPAGAVRPRHPALEAIEAALAKEAERLAALTHPSRAPAAALRSALRQLALVLPDLADRAALAHGGGAVAAVRARLAAKGVVPLPRMDAPAITLTLLATAQTDPDTALGRLRDLAAVAGRLAAEVMLVDPGHDPRLALLPSLVPNLRYVGDPTEAVKQARGHYVVLLDADAPDASAVVLGELLSRPGVTGWVLLGGDAIPGVEAVPLTAPVGLTVAMPLGLAVGDLSPLGLLREARAQGVPCRTLAPPWSAPPW